MFFHVGLVRFLNIETDGKDPFLIFVLQIKLRIVTAVKIILFLALSNNFVIRIMFFIYSRCFSRSLSKSFSSKW